VNVRDHGARGDGVSDDTQAMQAAINAAGPGSTVYWPPGIYLQRDQLKLNHKSNLTLKGEGPTSILRAQAGMNFYLGTGGEPGSGLVVQDLKLQGNPNATLAVNTGGIQVFGPNGTVIERVTFQDVTSAVYCAAPSKGTIVRDCSILGWGRICFFLNGGERIDRCQCVQTDPDRFGEKSSHGFYIHSGCDDAIIQDCRITGARKYAAQIYGEQVGTTTTNIVLRRLAIADCANGIIIASSQPTAAVAKNCTIEECTITGIYAGSSLAIKQGDGLKIRNNTINGNTGAAAGHSGMGCYVGWWAPYDNVPPGPSVTNSEIAGNRITGCDRGFSSLASNGGHFSGVSVHDNYFWGNRLNVDVDSSAAGAGVILLNNHLVAPPGAQQRSDAASLATSADLRPGEE
jgi:nitrous oxidase accessory protein NosD